MNPIFALRMLTLMGSVIQRFLAEDPYAFVEKTAERLRTSPAPGLANLLPGNLHSRGRGGSFDELVNQGEFTRALEGVVSGGKDPAGIQWGKAKYVAGRLQQLQEKPVPATRTVSSSGPPRVLYLLTNSLSHTSSGYTLRSHSTLKALEQEGVTVEAATRLAYPVVVGKFPRSDRETLDGVSYHRLLPWRYPATPRERDDLAVELLARRAEEFGANILHTTTPHTNAIVAQRAAARLGIPWVYEVRGEPERTWLSRQSEEVQKASPLPEYYRLARERETVYAQAADAVVVLSEISRQQLIDRGVESGKIHVVPNAVDDELIGRSFDRQAVRRELGIGPGPVVGTVTSVVDYEGLDVLVEAMTFLPEEVQMLVVGEGTARPALEQQVKARGLEDRVRFVGRKPHGDIWKWYGVLDAFVVPRKDTLVCRTVTPIKPLTAQALRIPVVASDLPALREVTGGLAFYAEAEKSEALAEEIRKALSAGSPSDAEAWAASRTWSANGKRYRSLYEGL